MVLERKGPYGKIQITYGEKRREEIRADRFIQKAKAATQIRKEARIAYAEESGPRSERKDVE